MVLLGCHPEVSGCIWWASLFKFCQRSWWVGDGIPCLWLSWFKKYFIFKTAHRLNRQKDKAKCTWCLCSTDLINRSIDLKQQTKLCHPRCSLQTLGWARTGSITGHRGSDACFLSRCIDGCETFHSWKFQKQPLAYHYTALSVSALQSRCWILSEYYHAFYLNIIHFIRILLSINTIKNLQLY